MEKPTSAVGSSPDGAAVLLSEYGRSSSVRYSGDISRGRLRKYHNSFGVHLSTLDCMIFRVQRALERGADNADFDSPARAFVQN